MSFHQGTNDYWVSVRGKVYDLTNYYKLAYVNYWLSNLSLARLTVCASTSHSHSDIPGEPSDTADMLLLAGLDLTPYFPM